MYPDEPQLAIPGGFQRSAEIAVAQPDLRAHVHIDLVDVADGELLEGVTHMTGRLRDGIEPFDTSFRVEFYEELDATLLRTQAAATDAEV
jgi:hypothetical protein